MNSTTTNTKTLAVKMETTVSLQAVGFERYFTTCVDLREKAKAACFSVSYQKKIVEVNQLVEVV